MVEVPVQWAKRNENNLLGQFPGAKGFVLACSVTTGSTELFLMYTSGQRRREAAK